MSENGVYPENRHLVGMVHHEIWGDLIRQTNFLTIWLVSDGRDHENGWIYLDFLMWKLPNIGYCRRFWWNHQILVKDRNCILGIVFFAFALEKDALPCLTKEYLGLKVGMESLWFFFKHSFASCTTGLVHLWPKIIWFQDTLNGRFRYTIQPRPEACNVGTRFSNLVVSDWIMILGVNNIYI